MNWGNSIVLVFVLFMTFIIQFVVRAFNEDFDLVSETYYKDEINYQSRIDDQSNLLKSGKQIEISQNKEGVVLAFPDQFMNAVGEIHFYHPSRTIFDRKFDIDLDSNGSQLIASNEIVKGRYTVKLDWKLEETGYYQEVDLYIR